MTINVSVQYNGGFLPDIIYYTVELDTGEPFKYHKELLSLQSMFSLNFF